MEPLQYQKLLSFTTVVLFEYYKHLDDFKTQSNGEVTLKMNTTKNDSDLVTAFTKE